jgi:hypothetical protein
MRIFGGHGMKIEIDLDDILGDEGGAETLQESVRRQVIDSVTNSIRKGVGTQIDHAVSKTISEEIKIFLTTKMPELCNEIMQAEYTPVNNYGQRGEPTTFRKELIRGVTENLQYKKTQYSSDRNAFTRAVDEVIEEHVKSFKADFTKQVDAGFTAAAMEYATTTLKKKLGIA